MRTGPATVERTLSTVERDIRVLFKVNYTVCRGMDGVLRLSADRELFTQGFLSSVKRVIVAFKVCDLGIFVCTWAVVSYMGILFS